MSTPIARAALPVTGRTARFEGADFASDSSFFWVRNDPGKGAELHRHPYTETFIVLTGTVDFSIDGVDSVVTADEIVVARPGEPHKFRNSGSGLLEMLAIHASPVMITEWL